MTLTDFLLARIAEDEVDARDRKEWSDCFACPTHERFDTHRVLAECEAKRRIVETPSPYLTPRGFPVLLAHLGLPYADHPDYRKEWKP